jgi:hypothetical protein
LASCVGSVGYWSGFGLPAMAKAAKKRAIIVKGPHILAESSWPPAIAADFIGVTENGSCCIVNQFGRLALVDFQSVNSDTGVASVSAELSGLGRKVLNFSVSGKRAVVLVKTESKEDSDPKLALVLINLLPSDAPSVVSRYDLGNLPEPTFLTFANDLICTGRVLENGKSTLSFFLIGRSKGSPISASGSLALANAFDEIALQDKSIVVLQSGEKSKLSLIEVANPNSPRARGSIELEGNYSKLGRYRDQVLVARHAQDDIAEIALLSVKSKINLLTTEKLQGINKVDQIVGQKDAFILLVQCTGGAALIETSVNKVSLSIGERFAVSGGEGGALAADTKAAYVGVGWNGVQAVKLSRNGMSAGAPYKIQRLPAFGLASWKNLVVLASSDLRLYDITQPAKPNLLKTTSSTKVIRAITGAGSYVLCLGKDEVELRRFEALDEIIATHEISGRQLCFDPIRKIAYVIKDEKNKAVAQQLKAYSNALIPGNSFEIGKAYSRVYADNGCLLVGNLNKLSLYDVEDTISLRGSRELENLAVRDFILRDDHIYATAIDPDSRGYLLVLASQKPDLEILNKIDLPHDGSALAASAETVATVGRKPDGTDALSVIKISANANPHIVTTLPALEAASSISIVSNIVLLAGRGLEIASLS